MTNKDDKDLWYIDIPENDIDLVYERIEEDDQDSQDKKARA